MGRPEAPQRSALLQGLGFIGDQMLQHRQQPGPVVRQLRNKVLDVVASRDGPDQLQLQLQGGHQLATHLG